MTIDPEALEQAARAIHDRYEALSNWVTTLGNPPRKMEDSALRVSAQKDAEAAITAYLAAERERGFAMMPRDPSVEMTDAADVDLQPSDVFVITGMRGIAVPKNDPSDQVRLFGSARANLWRAMFDAANPTDTKSTGGGEE